MQRTGVPASILAQGILETQAGSDLENQTIILV